VYRISRAAAATGVSLLGAAGQVQPLPAVRAAGAAAAAAAAAASTRGGIADENVPRFEVPKY